MIKKTLILIFFSATQMHGALLNLKTTARFLSLSRQAFFAVPPMNKNFFNTKKIVTIPLDKKEFNSIKKYMLTFDNPNLDTQDFIKLCAKGHGLNHEQEYVLETHRDTEGNTLLHYAAESKNPLFTQVLIKKFHMNPNICNDQGETPLFNAIDTNSTINVVALLGGGANPDHVNKHNFSLFQLAALRSNESIMRLLMEYSASKK